MEFDKKEYIYYVAPEIGQKIYDGAVGSAGFLCEAFDYLQNSTGDLHGRPNLSTKDFEILQKKTFYGKEKNHWPTLLAQ